MTRAHRSLQSNRRRSVRFHACAAIILAATTVQVVNAAPGTWTGTSGTALWSDSTQWAGGVIANDKGLVNIADFSTLALSADQVVRLDSYRLIGSLKFGDIDGTPNNWLIDNNGNANNKLQLEGDSYNGAGRPVIDVANGTTTISAAIVEGSSPNHQWIKSGAGTLVVTGAVTGVGGFVVAGGTAGSPSTLTFNNPTLNFGSSSATNNFFGYKNITVAFNAGETGVLNLQAGTLNTAYLSLAGDGANGQGNATLNITGGRLIAAAGGSASNNNSAAAINITNGELAIVSNGTFTAGKFFGRTTNVTIGNGGKLAFYSDAGTTLGGTGGWKVDGGATNFFLNTGGVISAPQFSSTVDNAGFVYFDGGTLQATASSTTFLGGRNTAGTSSRLFTRFRAGGGTIDTNGYDITMVNNLVHDSTALPSTADGGLIKNGAGTLTLTPNNAGNSFSGPAVINAGKLTVVDFPLSTPTVPSGIAGIPITIASGATLEFNLVTTDRSQNATSITGGGTLLKTGGNKLTLPTSAAGSSVALSAGALIDVQGGTLALADTTTTSPDWTGNRSDLNIAAGALVDGRGVDNVVVDKLTGSGTYQAGYFFTRKLTVGINGSSSTFDGVIQNNGVGGANVGVTQLIKTGNGTLTLTGNSTFSGGLTVNGGAVGTPSTVNLSPTGSMTIAGPIDVASPNGSVATINQSGGVVNATGGTLGNSGVATLNLSGTAVFNVGGTLNAAFNNGSSATITVDGTASLNLNNNAQLRMGGFFGRPTTINQNSGTVAAFSDVGTTPGGTGGLVVNGGTATYNLNGGTLAIPGVRWTSPSGGLGGGTGVFNFNGGTLRTVGNNADFFPGTNFTLRARAGGLIADTAGNAVAINNTIVHDASLGATADGGVTKIGAGTLTLGGANTYTGRTSVLDGTLVILNAAQTAVFTSGASIQGNVARLTFDYTGASSPQPAVVSLLQTSLAGGFVGTPFTVNAGTGVQIGWTDDGVSKLTLQRALAGDATLDGTVNFDDLLNLAANYNQSGKSWGQGDSTYDGTVNFDDLLKLAANYNQTITGSLAGDWSLAQASIPEPGAAVVLMGLAAVLRRSRRRATRVN